MSEIDDRNVLESADQIPQEEQGVSPRQLDATAMKAFAHPLRMAMYDYLNDHGSATATMLARHTGESTGQTSYHLRQLERHGFVTDDPDRGVGRERWWKALGFSVQGAELSKDSSTRPAVNSMLRHQIHQRAQVMEDWFQRSSEEPEEWVKASVDSRITVPLTAEEAMSLQNELTDILQKYALRAHEKPGDTLAANERRVRVYLDILPLPKNEV